VLAGNPAGDTQRFLVVVFNASQRPVAVVKTGLSDAARELMRREASFLGALPVGIVGVPKVNAVVASAEIDAFSMDFFAGDSPSRRQEDQLPRVLNSWLNAGQRRELSASPIWARLEAAASPSSQLKAVMEQLRGKHVSVTLQHGDFAPWNIKVSPGGKWAVLDWERGEQQGIPSWDWFHYVVQTAILVERLSGAVLVQRVERMLSAESFKDYARQSGITGFERPLLLMYLFYMVEVIKPGEGLDANRGLLGSLLGARDP
jgi:hypothetical protein